MILRGIVIIALAGISLYSSGVVPKVDNKEKEEAIMHTVRQMLDRIHFDPKEINDEFSEKMFDTYIELLDGSKRFLIQQDINQLSEYKLKIDDELKWNRLEFFNLSYDILNKGIERSRSYYKEVLDTPFDFENEEYLEMDGKKRDFAGDEIALKEHWRKLLKYEVLTRLSTAIADNKDSKEAQSIEEMEAETRKKVKKVYSDWYGRLDKIRRSDRFEVYVDALTHGFDPHSDYFSPKAKEDFDIRMQNKLEGIGARLQADGDHTKVVSIIPGGPAWKGKELEVNDLIMQVAQEGEEFVDITGMRLDDAVQLIRGKKGTKVTLQLKKKDGSLEEILIVRDEVIIEEGKAKSVIMNHSEIMDSIGFISLPSFYSDFSDKNGSSCSEDVAKEIEKLKKQEVKGIILDLRYNGGGSLGEVVEMAGFFIEDGPIVQVKPRETAPYVYTDRDKGEVKYDGPLVILVNSFSVSASEILAAALQDYGRAVIVGSKSTFGKGTVQRFWDLDKQIKGGNSIKPLGQIKITTQKFFRIDGGSTQLKGVLSDVVLPDTYHFLEMGEKELDNAMPWTQIKKREYKVNNQLIENLPEISKRSEERLKIDMEFSLVSEQAEILKSYRDKTIIPLSLKEYEIMNEERENIESKYEKTLNNKIQELSVNNLPQDISFIQLDSSRIARNEEWLKRLHKDIYAEEAMSVLKDIIELN